MQQRETTYSDQRLVNIMRITQVAMLLVSISYLLEWLVFAHAALSVNPFVFLSASAAIEVIIRRYHAGDKAQSFRIFLVFLVSAIFAAMFLRGGLNNLGIMAVPTVLMIGILYGHLKEILCLFVGVILATVLMGNEVIINYYPSLQDNNSTGIYRLVVATIVTCFAGFVASSIGDDMREAFHSLQLETDNLAVSEASIRRLSETDFLTGLVNAKQANADYAVLLSKRKSYQSIFFYFIDLDGFKEINDLFDHKSGDDLLILVANRLKSVSGESASVCRLSGDEFIVFFLENKNYDATIFAEKALAAIAKPHHLFGAMAQITASMGIATTNSLGGNEISFSDIRKKASMAMYQSKRESKRHFYLYSDLLEQQYMRRTYIIQGLKKGVQDGLLVLHYQPKVNLKTQKIMGMEALIRWENDNPQSYTPDEFMSVIESTELVHEIGDWVIREACTACKAWHDMGNKLSVAVNVSAQQLSRPSFAESVIETLSSVGLEGQFLEVELTERFLIEEKEDVEQQLRTLRNAGVRLAIDDFGTGYANVSYLTKLEADVLKIDKSFIDRLQINASIKPVIKAIVEIAKAGHMTIVAEGVETEVASKAIADLGCEVGQGYYWSKPMNQESVLALLAEKVAS